ncbi:hypothetical protein LCGC14_2842870 [marine sediment metagenome]|uniref:Uncharacterized protein n=1 Tax=marine sediment metagenome TaxID=412755 RepID=A0A0F9B1U7_9ZZZZ
MAIENMIFRYALVIFDVVLFINMLVIAYIAVGRSVVVHKYREKKDGKFKTIVIKEEAHSEAKLASAKVVVQIMWSQITAWISFTMFLTFRYAMNNFIK